MTTTTSSLGLAGHNRLSDLYASATRSLMAQNPGIKTIDAQLRRDDARLSSLGKMALALDGFRNAVGKSEVKMAHDPAAIGADVKAFVAAFNAMTGTLASLRTGDAASDTALNQVTAQMGQAIGQADPRALAAMGITRRNGGLALDEARLKTAIAADPDKVMGVFAKSGNGLAGQLARRAGQQIASGGAVANQAHAVQQEVDKLSGKKNMIADAVSRQAAMMAQQYALAGANAGGSALFGNGQVRPMSVYDYLA